MARAYSKLLFVCFLERAFDGIQKYVSKGKQLTSVCCELGLQYCILNLCSR
jgi:hypothetical protein